MKCTCVWSGEPQQLIDADRRLCAKCCLPVNTQIPIESDEHFEAYIAELRARRVVGRKEYGDWSFTRPVNNLLEEIQQELSDVSGWAAILWAKLEVLKAQGATIAEPQPTSEIEEKAKS